MEKFKKLKVINNIIIKKRNPGVDLLRILGMIDIVIYHIIISSNLYRKYPKYSKIFKYMEILTKWHISNFGIISGIVGYKTNKYSNLMYLWLTVVFYSLTIHYLYIKYFPQESKNRNIMEYIFPVIFKRYWYFTTYFVMYLFLPLINKGLSLAENFELRIYVISVISILFLWKDLISNHPSKFCSDTSTKTLLVYYLMGAYIGKYIINEKKNNIIIAKFMFNNK